MIAEDSQECAVAMYLPTGRDAELTSKVLGRAGIESLRCNSIQEICDAITRDNGVVMIAEEALSAGRFDALAEALECQPPWSDVPVLLLTVHGADSSIVGRALEHLGNVTLLERPARIGSLVSNARAAIRARQRQYQIRSHIAERVATVESLREADTRKDEFLATLAHELRNPLAPISNAIFVLGRASASKAETEWARQVIRRQVGHLTRLVDDLLDVSRITRGKLELRTATVNVASIITAAVETSYPLLTVAGHHLEVEMPAKPLTVEADAVRLAQVLANLLNNAAKYTGQGGVITLTAAERDEGVLITVRDTGIGIAPDMLPRIFDMFVQAENGLERTTGGLGIGLTLVKLLIALHGGTIEAASEGLGKGSEFRVWLPLAGTKER